MKVYTLDLLHQKRERAIAAFLLEGPDGWVLIETGPMSTLATLQARLQQHGVPADDVKHVLVTHIHLDHAGAAGWWAQQGATVYVHPVGAPHLVDPSRLWHSAGRIYGDAMQQLWGEVLPAPADRVVTIEDGQTVDVAGISVKAWDTPGHAWHHHVYQIGDVAFTGDAAGVRLTPDRWVSLPAPPPELDLDVWHKTIARIQAMRCETIYLTHFGKVEKPAAHLQQLDDLMTDAAAFVRDHVEAGTDREQLVQAYREWNKERALQAGTALEHFKGRYEAANPLFMSVDGIMRYLRKRAEKNGT